MPNPYLEKLKELTNKTYSPYNADQFKIITKKIIHHTEFKKIIETIDTLFTERKSPEWRFFIAFFGSALYTHITKNLDLPLTDSRLQDKIKWMENAIKIELEGFPFISCRIELARNLAALYKNHALQKETFHYSKLACDLCMESKPLLDRHIFPIF
jgi:hypothetical protein